MPDKLTNTMFIAIVGLLAIAAVSVVMVLFFPTIPKAIGQSYTHLVNTVTERFLNLGAQVGQHADGK